VSAEPVETLRRWERSGAMWRVVRQTDGMVEIALVTCTGAEQVDRLVSRDPALLAYVATKRVQATDPG